MKNLLYIFCLFTFQFTFAQSELPEGFGDYRTIPKAMIEMGKVYVVFFQPPDFQEFMWKDSILLLDQNQHVLKDLKLDKDYIIQTETVLIKPEYINWTFEEPKYEKAVDYMLGDTIFYGKDEWFYQKPLAIIPKQKYLMRDMLGIPNENLILWGFYEQSANQTRKINQKHHDSFFIETFSDKVDGTTYKAIKHHFPTQIDTFRTIHLLKNIHKDSLQFSSISIFRMTEAGSFVNLWREVSCSHCYHSTLSLDAILRMQKVLNTKGYDVPLNNVFDDETKAAILQFQKDNNLKQVGLSEETWKALGLQPIYHD